MIDPTMRIKVLPEYLIIHNFVKGVDYCNYEKYLIELLNNSNYFLQLGKSEFRIESRQFAMYFSALYIGMMILSLYL